MSPSSKNTHIIDTYLKGLSFKTDPYFVHNIVIAIWIVLVWRGIWNLTDYYLLPQYPNLSNMLSIIIGIAVLYLPDWHLNHLSGRHETMHQHDKTHPPSQDAVSSDEF